MADTLGTVGEKVNFVYGATGSKGDPVPIRTPGIDYSGTIERVYKAGSYEVWKKNAGSSWVDRSEGTVYAAVEYWLIEITGAVIGQHYEATILNAIQPGRKSRIATLHTMIKRADERHMPRMPRRFLLHSDMGSVEAEGCQFSQGSVSLYSRRETAVESYRNMRECRNLYENSKITWLDTDGED